MENTEKEQAALSRAVGNTSMSNYPAIFAGFIAKGIPEVDIKPRENVFTFNAWKALGKRVKRGEHGVRVITWIKATKEDGDNSGSRKSYSYPKSSTVFHVSQVQ